jgi:hypothetical protein
MLFYFLMGFCQSHKLWRTDWQALNARPIINAGRFIDES